MGIIVQHCPLLRERIVSQLLLLIDSLIKITLIVLHLDFHYLDGQRREVNLLAHECFGATQLDLKQHLCVAVTWSDSDTVQTEQPIRLK